MLLLANCLNWSCQPFGSGDWRHLIQWWCVGTQWNSITKQSQCVCGPCSDIQTFWLKPCSFSRKWCVHFSQQFKQSLLVILYTTFVAAVSAKDSDLLIWSWMLFCGWKCLIEKGQQIDSPWDHVWLLEWLSLKFGHNIFRSLKCQQLQQGSYNKRHLTDAQ